MRLKDRVALITGAGSGIGKATALTFAAFGVHVVSGAAYEPRTVVALSLRTLVWVTIAAIAWRRWAQPRA